MRARLQRGFTLIELMIALVIVALLAVLAAPMYGEMLANTEIRNASENILMGLRTAQGEAIHLNAPAKFVLAADGWQVFVTDPDSNDFAVTPWRTYQFSEGAQKANVSPTGGEVTFNGLGQIINNVDATVTLTQVNVTSAVITNPHKLRILVGSNAVAAGMKMCDPSYASTDPVGCP